MAPGLEVRIALGLGAVGRRGRRLAQLAGKLVHRVGQRRRHHGELLAPGPGCRRPRMHRVHLELKSVDFASQHWDLRGGLLEDPGRRGRRLWKLEKGQPVCYVFGVRLGLKEQLGQRDERLHGKAVLILIRSSGVGDVDGAVRGVLVRHFYSVYTVCAPVMRMRAMYDFARRAAMRKDRRSARPRRLHAHTARATLEL